MAPHYGWTKTKIIPLLVDEHTALNDLLWYTTLQYREARKTVHTYLESHPQLLSSKQFLKDIELLMHKTKQNPKPVCDFDAAFPRFPSGFRRAAIAEAFGAYQSWHTRFEAWKAKREKHEQKNQTRQAAGKKSLPFSVHPPQDAKEHYAWLSYYSTECKWLAPHMVLLKVFTGKAYVYRKIQCEKPVIVPQGYEMGSPTLVYKNNQWALHIPMVRPRVKLENVVTRANDPKGTFCMVDLGITHHAVCTIQTAEGRVLAVKHLRGKQNNHLRKLLLEKRNRLLSITKTIYKGETFAKDLYQKIRNLNDYIAHVVSKEIVAFAQSHQAKTIVFEYLDNFKPSKGTRSHRQNEKMMYWMKGRIVNYTRYKALHQGIVVNRVSAKNTSKQCPRCGSLKTVRYSQNNVNGFSLFGCLNCQLHDVNADYVGSLGVGRNFRTRYIS